MENYFSVVVRVKNVETETATHTYMVFGIKNWNKNLGYQTRKH